MRIDRNINKAALARTKKGWQTQLIMSLFIKAQRAGKNFDDFLSFLKLCHEKRI